MFGGYIPKSRVKSVASAKDANGVAYGFKPAVPIVERSPAGLKEAIRAGGAKGTETETVDGFTFRDSCDLLPTEADKVVDYVASVAIVKDKKTVSVQTAPAPRKGNGRTNKMPEDAPAAQ